jgi:death-on-curing protein
VTGAPVEQVSREINLALADAALKAPFTGVADTELFPDLEEKIAVLGYRLARYHALPDGNKRLAWAAMRMFAALNGLPWSRPAGGEDEVVDVMFAAAAGELAEGDFISWVRERVQPDTP